MAWPAPWPAPTGPPQFEADGNAKMQMCDLCLERWQEGGKPVCVDACPMRALDAGPLAELRARYGEVREAGGFIYQPQVGPSVLFKPRLYVVSKNGTLRS